jgi:hypothetical protein
MIVNKRPIGIFASVETKTAAWHGYEARQLLPCRRSVVELLRSLELAMKGLFAFVPVLTGVAGFTTACGKNDNAEAPTKVGTDWPDTFDVSLGTPS